MRKTVLLYFAGRSIKDIPPRKEYGSDLIIIDPFTLLPTILPLRIYHTNLSTLTSNDIIQAYSLQYCNNKRLETTQCPASWIFYSIYTDEV